MKGTYSVDILNKKNTENNYWKNYRNALIKYFFTSYIQKD